MLLTLLAVWTGPVSAGEADVVEAEVEITGTNTYRFSATVRHADDGWEHYADQWEVLGPNGDVLATRVLQHPHVEEQPFTRSLGDVEIPPDVTSVRVRAHDSEHSYGGSEITIDLPVRGSSG